MLAVKISEIYKILEICLLLFVMPILRTSTYRRPRFLLNGHLETIFPSVFRKVKGVDYERERIETPDGDFLDLDWLDSRSRRLVILSHGLEGDSNRAYVRGMAKFFSRQNWDVLAWNCRSCSGEMNRSMRLYHHGEIGDIGEVILHALRTKDYEFIALVGFSMGGNIEMKYLGVHGKEAPEAVRACVAFSSPTDLEAAAAVLDLRGNFIYKRRFLHYLSLKMQAKNEQFPGKINLEKLTQIKVWRDFDEHFSAPLNGFRDAADFYEQASAKNFMSGIAVPTLLVQAKNDPILTPECFPVDICERHPKVFLEMPKHGGHVGFLQAGSEFAWSERRAFEFVNALKS